MSSRSQSKNGARQSIRVLIADDHVTVLEGLTAMWLPLSASCRPCWKA